MNLPLGHPRIVDDRPKRRKMVLVLVEGIVARRVTQAMESVLRSVLKWVESWEGRRMAQAAAVS